jgi:6-phospho-beta-glucosidase
VIRDVAKALLRARSSAWHIVVSNPVDITTHAACVVRPERTFGLCDMPWKVLRATAMAGGVPLSDLTYSYCGLNHLSWVAAVRDEDGKDVLGTIVDGPGLLDVFSATLGTDSRLAKGLVAVTRQLRAIPSPYLRYYYCATELIERARRAQTTRGEECESVQKYFEKACRDGDHALANNLARRRGGWGIGVTVARACAQVLGTEQATAIPCGPNRGIVGFLEDDAIVEAPRRLSDFAAVDEAQPLLHRHIRGLMSQVAAYEWLAADAATSGEFDSAVMAAASNPLIPSVDLARRLLAETIDEQKQWLPQFQ